MNIDFRQHLDFLRADMEKIQKDNMKKFIQTKYKSNKKDKKVK
mgnify:CR=1 FL=1